MFTPGQRVGVAVSGGADSVCLLHVLLELAPRLDLMLHVLHLDHGLRGEESRVDARFVADLAARLGLPLHAAAADVRARAAADNLEQAAREARREFFAGLRTGGTIDRVALGHTRSDQAETVLYRFLRGAGTAGLAGIRPVTAEGIVRPLIEVDRAEVLAYLAERNIAWREDASNADLAFDRNRIRHVLLPQLVRDWNPALTATLAQMADWAREEEVYWDAEMARLEVEQIVHQPPAVLLETAALRALAPAVARRLVRRAIAIVRGHLRGIDFAHVRDILDLAASSEGSGRMQVPGLDVFRSFDWLRLAAPEAAAARNFSAGLTPPARAELPNGSAVAIEVIEISGFTGTCDSVYNDEVGCLDWKRVSGPLEVRNWRPGDKYQPAGYPGEDKIKVFFQKARIPLWERRYWPVLVDGSEIIWARQFGPAAAYAAGPGSRLVLRVRYLPANSWNRRRTG